MAHFDFVLETSTSTGGGNLTLDGAVVGHRTFASVYTPVTDAVYYGVVAVDAVGVPTGEWEVGLGRLTVGGQLERLIVHASSNSDAPVTFGVGTKRVYAAQSVAAVTAIVNAAITAHVAASDPHGDRAYAAGLVVPVERGVGDEWIWRPMMSLHTLDPIPLVRMGSGGASIALVDPGASLGFGAVRLSSGTGAGSIYSIFQSNAHSRIRVGLLMRVRFTPQLATAQAQRTSGFFDINAKNGAGFFFAGLNVVARAGLGAGTQTSTTYTLTAGAPYILETEVLSTSSAKFSVYDGLTGGLLWTETVTGVTFPAVGVRVWAFGSSHISAPGVATVLDDLHDYGFGTRIGYEVHRKGPQ